MRCTARLNPSTIETRCWAEHGHTGPHWRYGNPEDPKQSWPNVTVTHRIRTTIKELIRR